MKFADIDILPKNSDIFTTTTVSIFQYHSGPLL